MQIALRYATDPTDGLAHGVIEWNNGDPVLLPDGTPLTMRQEDLLIRVAGALRQGDLPDMYVRTGRTVGINRYQIIDRSEIIGAMVESLRRALLQIKNRTLEVR